MKEKGEKSMRFGKKEEYIAVDFFKVACALMVVSLHLLPFADINPDFLYWFNQVLARVAVPFFFVSSGFFFADKIDDRNAVKKRLKRILLLYFIYTILHLNLIIKDLWLTDQGWIDVAANMIFLGTYVQLWYLGSLFTAMIILYFTINILKINTHTLIILIAILYVVGTLGNAYIGPIYGESSVRGYIEWYFNIFKTTRNGLFMGFPFVCMGYLIKKGVLHHIIKPYQVMFALGLVTFEVYAGKYIWGIEGASMYFSLPLLTYTCFAWIAAVPVNTKYKTVGKTCRKLSFLIYGLHMMVHKNVGHYVYYKVNSLGYYLIIVGATFVLAFSIIWISKYKYFKWLEILY